MNNYNISGNLGEIFVKANFIAEEYQIPEVQNFCVALAILTERDCVICQQYAERGLLIDVSGMMYSLSVDADLYEEVTGHRYPIQDEPVKAAESNDVVQEDVTDNNEEEENKDVNFVFVFTSNNESASYDTIPNSEELNRALEDANKRCRNAGVDYIDTDNLLFSILNDEECSACKMLKLFKYDIEEFKDMLLYNSNIYESNGSGEVIIPKILENSCTIMNNKYTKGEECQILKRDDEIFTAWNIFSKKTKRNCILVGEAGVGKTAIVEALTMQIVNGKCPKEFKNYKVVSLDLNSMVAGTKYRGEFENKVQTFIKFIERTPNLIVFVDEIHQILGTGSAEGSGPDLSGSLKPILARDDVVFIGSTTIQEYERFFSRDPAFKRRFEKVEVREPKLKEVKSMIKLRVQNISKHHGVEIDDELLDYIIITAKVMNYYGKNPDLSVDLVDRSMAIAKMRKAKKLERRDVDKVFFKNYSNYKRISKKDKLSTAYHEAGHALVRMLAKYDLREDVQVVSIVPTADYLGVTITENNNSFRPITRKAVLENAGMSLAGRVSQEYVEKDWDFGASSDLVAATDIVRRMIVEMGMDESVYTNISLYNYGENHTMSPEAIDKVNERIKEIMKEVYENTKLLLEKNKTALVTMVELLMKRGIISIEEIRAEFKEKKIKLKK